MAERRDVTRAEAETGGNIDAGEKRIDWEHEEEHRIREDEYEKDREEQGGADDCTGSSW